MGGVEQRVQIGGSELLRSADVERQRGAAFDEDLGRSPVRRIAIIEGSLLGKCQSPRENRSSRRYRYLRPKGSACSGRAWPGPGNCLRYWDRRRAGESEIAAGGIACIQTEDRAELKAAAHGITQPCDDGHVVRREFIRAADVQGQCRSAIDHDIGRRPSAARRGNRVSRVERDPLGELDVPPRTVVGPVYVFVPERTSFPVPKYVKPLPALVPSVTGPAMLTVAEPWMASIWGAVLPGPVSA